MIRRFTLLILGVLVGHAAMWAQKTVSGTVTNSDGLPMIGVNVLEEGTTNGTVTDLDGKYTLELTNPNATLLFSFTGYEPVREAVGDREVIDVVIREDVEILDEIVVTALGFRERRDEMGSTYSAVHSEDIVRSGEATFLNALGAKASNVQIARTNGDPGAGTIIRIRGANTISGSSNPLIILDGIPVSNSTLYGGGNNATGGRTGGVSQQSRLNDLNPNDVESVQILKGASAAALWGSRAANGVIVITTKNGRPGKLNISYKSTLSFDEVSERIPMQTVWGQGRSGSYSPTRAESWGDYIPERPGGEDVVDKSGEHFIAEDGTVYYPIEEKNSRETFVDSNWDAVFQTGGFWQHDLSISGGSERATYFFSLGRLDQDGIIRNSYYDRTNLRLNNRFILTDWLSITSKAGYTNTASNRIQQSSNTAGLQLGLLRTPPDFDIRDYKGTYVDDDGNAFPGRHRAYRRYLGGPSTNPIYNNPLWTINEQTSTTNVNRFIMSTEMNITPLNWLQLTLRGGVDNYEDKRVYLFPIGSAGDRNPGIFTEDIIAERELNFDAIGKANFKISSNLDLDATLGWNINDRQRRFNTATVTGFLVNAKKATADLNTAAENSTWDNTKRFIRSNRGYGILGFNLYDQLFLNVSGALEASSTAQGTFFYPAVDLAWQFTESISTSSFLSFGKVRGSWGKVGVQPPAHRAQTLAEGSFTYSTYSDPVNIALFGGGFRIDDDRGNPELEPEIKTEWEVGLDLRLFNDALSLAMTYYQNEIDGLIFGVELTPSSGFDTEIANAGSMENKGFELETSWNILRKNDWKIGLNGNFSRNKNTVTSLAGTETIDLTPGASVSSRAVQGYSLGVLYGTGSQTDENGNFILDDNGFPQITPSPIVLGDPNPDWRAGLGLNIAWKSLALNVLFEHSQGGEYSPRTLWVLRRFGTTLETADRITLEQDLFNYAGDLIPAGTTVRGKIADFGGGPVLLDESWYRTGIGGGFGDNQAYNFSIVDATFTRLRELSLSYVLNTPNFKQKTRLSSIVFRATARNFFLWDEITGVDPETNQVGVSNGFGLEYFTNPSTRSFLFSIAINY
ncbi:MAG: SusC/RagA family TonB-linked outer membrane protein [Bacteroidetes bacterium]|nr:MAG: SusC/RagA family TonB-linked outer membrane protein [Bacteroidota bacterium]